MFYDFIFKSDMPITPDCMVVNTATVSTSNLDGSESSNRLIIQANIVLHFDHEISIAVNLDYTRDIAVDVRLSDTLDVLKELLALPFTPNFPPYQIKKKPNTEDVFSNIVSELDVKVFCSNNSDSINTLKAEGIEIFDDSEYGTIGLFDKKEITNSLLPNLEMLLKGSTLDDKGNVLTLRDVASEERREQIFCLQEFIDNSIRLEASKSIVNRACKERDDNYRPF